jgi:hypothetical protein
MEQHKDSAGQQEQAREWETARAKLADLIDNPERHVPVREYRAHLQAAQKAVARAYKAMMAARA